MCEFDETSFDTGNDDTSASFDETSTDFADTSDIDSFDEDAGDGDTIVNTDSVEIPEDANNSKPSTRGLLKGIK
jgi:hypothetical protein